LIPLLALNINHFELQNANTASAYRNNLSMSKPSRMPEAMIVHSVVKAALTGLDAMLRGYH
jgi:hypothetical protein